MNSYAISILGVAVITALAGCAAGRSASQKPLPGTHIAEYRQIVTDSQKIVKKTLHSLDAVGAQTTSSPQQAVNQLADEVRRLEVGSLKARAHAQAMLARGDAYFEQWHDNLARIKDAEVRALAEQHRPLLQQSFTRVKQLSQDTREAFRLFLSDLRNVRNLLETDPAATANERTQELIRGARGHGEQVERKLADLLDELNTIAALVNPLRTPSKK